MKHHNEAVIGDSIGLVIKSIDLGPNEPHGPDKVAIRFTDGSELSLFDKGQQCCENRFIRTDDDLTSFNGAVFLNVETREAARLEDTDDEVHDVAFLVVLTSAGEIVFSTHKHNGYYSGFDLVAESGPKTAHLLVN